MQDRLFKITWKIPYAKYETYVFGNDEEDAKEKFIDEICEEVKWSDVEIIEIKKAASCGVIVTKYLG